MDAMSTDTGLPGALPAWEVTYQIWSVIDDAPAGALVAEDSVVVTAPDQNVAARAAVMWVYDNEPRCDVRVGPIVKVVAVDQAELEEAEEDVEV